MCRGQQLSRRCHADFTKISAQRRLPVSTFPYTKQELDDINVIDMLIGLGAGLAIFFFGVYEMTLGMREAAADRVRSVLERFTKNRIAAVGVGAGVTAVVGSSSIVTIMTVGMVSSGLLAFQSSLGVVMGANIGTTVSSQIVAFGLTDFFGVVLIVGAVLRFLVRTDLAKAWGTAIMGVGFVFLGLEQIEAAMVPLRSSDVFMTAISRMESPFIGILIGAAITAVIQSSSATMGVVIILAGQGAITLPAGIAIMMGAELGTCVDTLLSTIGQTRDAVRTGVFQLMFNVFNVLLLVGFTGQLAEIVQWMTPASGAQEVAKQIAHAHVMFNCLGVLAALPFIPLMSRNMLRLIPPAGEASALDRPPVPVRALARAEGEDARQKCDREHDPAAGQYAAHERV